MKRTSRAVVINGIAVDKLDDLKKEYIAKNKKSISYDAILTKLLIKAKYEDISD